MNRLKYIWMIILLAVAARVTAQESYVIDTVCVEAERYYRIEGEEGSTYFWMYTDTAGTQYSVNETPFSEPDGSGGTIFGSEAFVKWNTSGSFILSAVQTSIYGCDTIQAGEVIVYEQADAFAGAPLTICQGDTVFLNEAISSNFSKVYWSSSGDGRFIDSTIVQAAYLPGGNDFINESVKLYLTAEGLGDGASCTPAVDSIEITILVPEIPTFEPFDELCIEKPAPELPASSLEGITGTWFPENIDLTFVGTTTYTFTPDPEFCAVQTTLDVITIDEIKPVFDQIAPICKNELYPPQLPVLSNNPIPMVGSWSPSAIITDTTRWYYFTPDPGQCGLPDSMKIEITEPLVPEFDSILPICQFDNNPPQLIAVSNNGIPGSWSPDTIDYIAPGIHTYTFTPDTTWCAIPIEIQIETLEKLTPVFEPIEDICQFRDAPALADTSLNGIPGDWVPSAIVTSVTGQRKHTFTPHPDYCAFPTEITVNVLVPDVPEFIQIEPICYNTTPPLLPETSVNGITGTWNPAVIQTSSVGTDTYTFSPDSIFCAETITMDIEVTDEIRPVFDYPDKVCWNETAPTLPVATENTPPLLGSWEPATVTTDSAGIFYYVFTPDPGQCGITDSIRIEVVEQIDPVFAPIDPICQYDAAPTLPTISDNGVPGSWDKAIDTSIFGKDTLTFTPAPGQCGDPFKLAVTIIERVQPTFNPMGPYCLNSETDELPATSLQGIPGTWSPSQIITSVSGPRWYTFTPEAGICASNQSIKIEVVGSMNLSASTQNINCKGDNSGSIDIHVSGGSGDYSFVWDHGPTSEDLSELPAGTYHLTVTDINNGCQNKLTVNLTEPAMNDTEAPIILAPDIKYFQCDTIISPYSNYDTFVNEGGLITDNMGFDPEKFILRKETIVTTGFQTRIEHIYEISDYCNNRAEDTVVFIIEDTTSPQVSCRDITISLDENGTYELTEADIDSIAWFSSDNCTDFEELKLSLTPKTFNCEQVGKTITGTLIVTDLSGNLDSCQATISIVDNHPPQITCQDIDLYLNTNGEGQLDTSKVITQLSDNCGIDTVIISQQNFTCANVGENELTITAYDIHGLSSFCNFKAFVHDTISPSVTCNDYHITLNASEHFKLEYGMIAGNIYDNCEIDTIILSKTDFGCADVGDNQVTVTVIDVSGNQASCISTTTVSLDNVPPLANDDKNYVTVTAAPIQIPVLDNDTDNRMIVPSSLTVFENPENGSVSVNSNNEIVYVSNPGFVGLDEFTYFVCDEGIPCYPLCDTAKVTVQVLPPNNAPVANADFYEAGCYPVKENLLINDYDPDGDQIIINTIALESPKLGILSIEESGMALFEFSRGISGLDWFIYEICDDNYFPLCDTAIVYINIFDDFDCDNIPNHIDIDDDNDGIIDVVEGDTAVDTDGDGTPDSLDIDSDGDGIPDNIEAQAEGTYIAPTCNDENRNGLDDVYETDRLGLNPVDTDGDLSPDYLDLDTDNDGVPDNIEGYDLGAKGIAEVNRTGYDDDNDGLDDGYDIFFGGFNENELHNPFGTEAHLQDFDNDGTRDWRDTDDDNDDILTKFEDLNNNGVYYDDDRDFDGHPEYLDYMGECSLFIPEGFSPDGDGINDYFQIYCIHNYPNAKLMIFHRNGNLLFQKEHYGSQEHWGNFENSWWDGKVNQVLVEPEVYLYILDKGNGKLERGFVMVSY